MRIISWLIINKNGIKAVRKTKPALDFDEISMKITLEVPDALFDRPQLEAKIQIAELENNSFNAEVIANTAALIEQQLGAKVVFKIEQN